MRMLLLLLLALPCLAMRGNFPDKMVGTYQLETSQGFSDLMYDLGVNWFTRQVRWVTQQLFLV